MATAPQPSRRFRLSLRTLLFAVGILSAAFAGLRWQRSIVEERGRFIKQIGTPGSSGSSDPNYVLFGCPESKWMDYVRADIPLTWRLLGAEAVFIIHLDSAEYSEADARQYAKLFPEAVISLHSQGVHVLSILPPNAMR